MRRPVQRTATKISADIKRLVALIKTCMDAPSHLEKKFWVAQLHQTIGDKLRQGHQTILDACLDFLFKNDVEAYDVFVEAVENVSQSCTITHQEKQQDVLLFAAPVLAWTRFAIGSGVLTEATVSALKNILQEHVFSADAVIALGPSLLAIEQLPANHTEVLKLMQEISALPLGIKAGKAVVKAPPTIPFLADTRYLIGTVTVAHNTAIYRWQQADNPIDYARIIKTAEQAWAAAAYPHLSPALPGCTLNFLLPQSYFYSCRQADKLIRPATIHAAIHYLTHQLETSANKLKVVIGKFSHNMDDEIDEYRIGFTKEDSSSIYYGTVWPLYENEDDDELAMSLFPDADITHPMEPIRALLKTLDIIHIKELTEVFPAEFCDDCNSPLFANDDGDLVHAEMPDEILERAEHLH
jgi:hypothetical protein